MVPAVAHFSSGVSLTRHGKGRAVLAARPWREMSPRCLSAVKGVITTANLRAMGGCGVSPMIAIAQATIVSLSQRESHHE